MPPTRAAATASPGGGAPALLHAINASTKWLVSGTAAALAAHRRDAAVGWAIIGAVAAAFLGKLLKRVINQARPPTATGLKADPGMPSSHANSLAFLGTYAAVGLVQGGGGGRRAAAAAVLALAAALTWLRVRLGLHTPAQVMVGAALGVVSAVAWAALGAAWALPAAAAHPQVEAALVGATVVAGVVFAVTNLRPAFALKR